VSASKIQFSIPVIQNSNILTASQSPPDPKATFGYGFKLPDTGHWQSKAIDPNELFDMLRDRSGSGIKFNSSLVPPNLKRTQNIEEFLPWL